MTSNTIEITGTGGIIEGNLGSANVNVNLDPVLNVNGTDNVIVATSANFRSSDDVGAVTAWVKTTNGSTQTIFSAGDTADDDNYASFYLVGRPHIRLQEGSIKYTIRTNTFVNDGSWHHIAWVCDGSAIKIYIDGVDETLVVDHGSNNGDWFNEFNQLDNVVISALQRESTTQFFNGYIADVRYY